jgi:hypothetical protein
MAERFYGRQQELGYFVVYNDRIIPRYVAVDNVAALEHKLASNGE